MSRRNGGDTVNNEPAGRIVFRIPFFQQYICQSKRKMFQTNLRKNLKAVHATLREVQNDVIARYVT